VLFSTGGDFRVVSAMNRLRDGQGFEQNPEIQESLLSQMTTKRGWAFMDVHSDRMSGAKENREFAGDYGQRQPGWPGNCHSVR
jgi:hypothetical protein